MKNHIDSNNYIKPGFYVDSDAPNVLEFAQVHGQGHTLRKKAISLFLLFVMVSLMTPIT
ncbi:MAG: hypothetical protein RQM92_11930 [Candidatus Syntrophopropionicum ammoniitolerans]